VSAVETPPEQPTDRQCPRCGAAMAEQQEWCLHCGAAVGTRVVAAPGWRAPIAIAGVILTLAAIAVAVAIVQLADDTDRVAETPAAVNASPTPPPVATPAPALTPDPAATTTPDPTLPEASGQETPTPSPTSTPEPTTTPDAGGTSGSGGDAEWPTEKSGWTVVLASDTSESEARDKAKRFAADGISGVGVLDSDDFSSLRGGYWVVFAGRYDGQSKASDALDGVDARDAYIRRIVPD